MQNVIFPICVSILILICFSDPRPMIGMPGSRTMIMAPIIAKEKIFWEPSGSTEISLLPDPASSNEATQARELVGRAVFPAELTHSRVGCLKCRQRTCSLGRTSEVTGLSYAPPRKMENIEITDKFYDQVLSILWSPKILAQILNMSLKE